LRWREDPGIRLIVVTAEGGRAFCAGGDIKKAYLMGRDGLTGNDGRPLVAEYFAREYQLNRLLFGYPKAIVAFMDGITMGGGYGLAESCRFRVGEPGSSFAMPEVGIGFFPDVGALYYLSRFPAALGRYLALTGNRVTVRDMRACGIVTHVCSPSRREEIVAALRAAAGGNDAGSDNIEARVQEILEGNDADESLPEGLSPDARDIVGRAFSHLALPDILAALKREEGAFAAQCVETILSRSPTSLLVTLDHLNAAGHKNFNELIEADFRLAQHFLADRDFYEGVRAQIVDKDRSPKWAPASLDAVTESVFGRYRGAAPFALDDF